MNDMKLLDSDITEIVQGLGETAQAFSGKTVLVTGGCGFLGKYFTQVFSLLNKGSLSEPCKVMLMDNFITQESSFWDQFAGEEHLEFVRHDVTKDYNFEGKIDYIIHAAGIASPYYYRAFPLETFDVAINGTRKMLELAEKKKAKFVFFSSSEIYGDPDPKYVPTSENYRGNVSCLGPRACYDESKRAGETLCRMFHTLHKAETRIIRPFNVYGVGMSEKDYRVLPNFASRVLNDKSLMVYGDGHQTRTFCYITDAIIGFLLVLVNGKSGEAYNIGNPKPEVSMRDLVASLEKVMDRKVKVDYVDYPDSYPGDEPMRRCPDITKAKIHTGYQPKIGLEEGLRRFMAWAETCYTRDDDSSAGDNDSGSKSTKTKKASLSSKSAH